MRFITLSLALVVLALTMPLAAAGTADDPEATDDAGDAMAGGAAPAPAGYDDLDLLAAWFEDETLTTLPLKVQVAGAWTERANTGIEVGISVNGNGFAAGYINMPGFYTGPYLCPEGSQDGTGCIGAEGGWVGNVLTVEIPRDNENVSDAVAGDEVLIRGAESYEFIALFAGGAPDTMAEGRPYVLQLGGDGEGEAPDVLDDVPELDEELNATATDNPAGGASGDGNETPLPVWLVPVALAAVGLSRKGSSRWAR